jgi:hypothetical protein
MKKISILHVIISILILCLVWGCKDKHHRRGPSGFGIPAEELSESPYYGYSILFNPGSGGLNAGRDSLFFSRKAARLSATTGYFEDFTLSSSPSDPTAIRFNMAAGTLRFRLAFTQDGTATITEGTTSLSPKEHFFSDPGSRHNRFFFDTFDHILSMESLVILRDGTEIDGKAIFDADQGATSPPDAELIAFNTKLRNQTLTTRDPTEFFADRAPFGLTVCMKEKKGNYHLSSFARAGDGEGRFFLVQLCAGVMEQVKVETTNYAAPNPADATRQTTITRTPISAFVCGELAINGLGEIYSGVMAPSFDQDFGPGENLKAIGVYGRLFPLDATGNESTGGHNTTGLFGGTYVSTDGGPDFQTQTSIKEVKLSEDGNYAFGVAETAYEFHSIAYDNAKTADATDDKKIDVHTRIQVGSLLGLIRLEASIVSPAGEEDTGNAYHFFGVSPYDATADPFQISDPAGTASDSTLVRIYNGGVPGYPPSSSDQFPYLRANGPGGGGNNDCYLRFFSTFFFNTLSQPEIDRYSAKGRLHTGDFSQVGGWYFPGRSDVFSSHAFGFGSVSGDPLEEFSVEGQLAEYAILAPGGSVGAGATGEEDGIVPQYFILMKKGPLKEEDRNIILRLTP